MLRVESAQPCDGPDGTYEVWAHHFWPGRGVATLSRLTFAGDDALERDLGVPEVSDPWVVLGLAENATANNRPLQELGMPAVTSLIRLCNREDHRDRVRTERGTRRPEAVARVLWVAPLAGEVALDAAHLQIDGGIQQHPTRRSRAPQVVSNPLVSVPMTGAENERFLYHSTIGVIGPSGCASPMKAIVHRDADGILLERLHVVFPSNLPAI